MLDIVFTSADYRQGLEEFLEAKGERALVGMDFLEGRFSEFIRQHCDSNFTEIFDVRETNYFSRLEKEVKRNQTLYRQITIEEPMLARGLKTLNAFFASSFRPQPKLKPNKRNVKTPSASHVETPNPQKDFPTHNEGARKEMELEKAYRNRAARNDCIAYWGAQCQVCGLRFKDDYGELGADYIEVHHLVPVSSREGEYDIDPVNDLVPLCSNCHSMIHRSGAMPMSLSELRDNYKGPKRKIDRLKP